MRVLKDLPEIEEKINSGALSLSHLGTAQSLFMREPNLSKNKKLEVLKSFEHKTKREVEKIAAQISPLKFSQSDRVKYVSENEVEIRFIVNEAFLKKLDKRRGLLAHKKPNIKMAELFDMVCDLGIEKWDKSDDQASAPARVTLRQSKAAKERFIHKRDGGKCRICGSQYALEIDHILPKSMGGEDNIENLRLLCRLCNQREAIRILGLKKMDPYINGNQTPPV